MICDKELIKAFLSGEQDAFPKIIKKYKGYVFAVILNFVKEYDEVENIAQEVFIQIYRYLPRYRQKNLKGWIGKIAATKAIDWKRSKGKRIIKEIEDIESVNDEIESEYNPEETLLKKENSKIVHEICNNMSEIYSSVINKYYFEGKSYQQISQENNITLKTVESRLYRARKIFKEKWREKT